MQKCYVAAMRPFSNGFEHSLAHPAFGLMFSYLNIYQTDFHQIGRVGRIMAADERPARAKKCNCCARRRQTH